jgi:hypothetical protein
LKKIRLPLALASLFALLLLSGCGDRVSILTGEVAKQMGTSGVEEKIREPGTFRMDACLLSACPKLIRLQVNMDTVDVNIDSLFLPKSNVDLTNVVAGIQFRIRPDHKSINTVYQDVPPTQVSGNVYLITTDAVWKRYGQRKAPDAIVTALRQYIVDDVLSNVPEIARYTRDKVNEMLAGTPIEITELGFPNGIGEVPDEVRQSKRRLFAIEDEKAREVKALAAALEVEDQRQAVARKRAENDAEIARALNISVAQYQCLRTMDAFADAAENGTTIAYSGSCGLDAGEQNAVQYVPRGGQQ